MGRCDFQHNILGNLHFCLPYREMGITRMTFQENTRLFTDKNLTFFCFHGS
jgi:hypothetical protein